MSDRKYRVIIYGATGFTGGLVAEYFASSSGLDKSDWAIAGRSKSKLEAVKTRLTRIDPDCAKLNIITADSKDIPALTKMTSLSSVIVTTVGPYALHGEELVAACVASGTHYLDITGEPNFVKKMLAKHDREAKEKNVLIVNCCGFDSIPADLGAYYTARQFDGNEPVTIKGFVYSKGTFSGGTWASALNAMAEGMDRGDGASKHSTSRLNSTIHYDKASGKWAVPMPVIDPWMVKRSAQMRQDVYGTDFQYGQYIGLKSPFAVAGLVGGVGLVFAGAQFSPLRKMMMNLKKSGDGPSAEERSNSFFKLTFYGESASKKIVTTVSGGDPGYSETSKMLSESALTILEHYNELPVKGGVVTPAGGLGDFLLRRLQAKGIKFETISDI